jgi:glycosyltransferase 2 family protein
VRGEINARFASLKRVLLAQRRGHWNNATMEPESAEPKPRRASIVIAACVKIALAVVLLGALFYYGSIDLASLGGLAQRPGAVVASAFLLLLTLPLGAWRWGYSLRILDLTLPWRTLFHVQNIASFSAQFLLGTASADAVRGVYAWRALGGQSPRIALSLVADRVVSLAALMLLTIVFMLLRWERVAASAPLTAILLSLALALAAMVVGAIALMLAPAVLERLQPLAAAYPRIALLLSQMGDVIVALRRHLPAATMAFVVALIGGIINIASVVVLAVSLQLGPLGALDYWVATPLAILANVLPLTPGGIGVGEAAFDQVCVWLDAARSGAGYAGAFLAFRAVSMVVMLIGLVSFVMHRADAVPTSAK